MKRRVIVLGAGFSKSISRSSPTMSNLNGALFYGDLERYPALRSYLERYREALGDEPEYVSIERFGTALFSTELVGSLQDRLELEATRLDFLRWLADSIRHTGISVDPNAQTPLRRFLETISLAGDPRVEAPGVRLITLNYDLLIESILDWNYDYYLRLAEYDVPRDSPVPAGRTSVQPELPIDGDDRVGATRPGNLVLPYLKIHGSLNWYRAAGADRNDVSSVMHLRAGSVSDSIYRADPPVFVPMAHTRSAFLNGTLFPTLWRTMVHYLSRAEEICFLGYGFPDTDLTLLLEFARHKDRVSTIVIKEEPETFERKAGRLRRLFPDSRVENRDALDWIEERARSATKME